MAKLTKAQAKAHQQACDLLNKDVLSDDEKFFVIENWQESAMHINSTSGAFFTPYGLARDFAIETFSGRMIDLCAGIGTLSFAASMMHRWSSARLDITCIEINPAYVAVGRKILPEATWIEASVFDVIDMDLGRFDIAISNPPFGRITRPDGKRSPRYTGAEFEFHVIDIAAHLAGYGVFILPQMSSGFRYSGSQHYQRDTSGKAFDFQQKTGVYFGPSCGIDTATYLGDWRGVSPLCEVVCCEFAELAAVPCHDAHVQLPTTVYQATSKPTGTTSQLSLFGEVV
ncbi:methyltransferase [Rhizobium alvei]|uniref:Methyltransferase n=1 Tax=Rhizobium alvei TaxID=1132659 RepID=A0ABT8YT62_9HYPH|nr:methyltransferase [Rhizobium alvei]MDO6966958.1 methyltransferase [Rhizobium alvei]